MNASEFLDTYFFGSQYYLYGIKPAVFLLTLLWRLLGRF